MKKIFILLLVFIPFFLYSQVQLVSTDVAKIYPDDTHITYMQLSDYPVDIDFLQFVEKEVLSDTLIQRFNLSKDGKACFYHSHKDITGDMIVEAINEAYYLYFTTEANKPKKEVINKSISKQYYAKSTAQRNVKSVSTLSLKNLEDNGIYGDFLPQNEILSETPSSTFSFKSGASDLVDTMECGLTYTASLTSSGGSWTNYTDVSRTYTGSEQVWSFTAPTTGLYTFNVDEGTADADFFLMSACNPNSTNLSSGNWDHGSYTISLTAGTTYYLIADLYSSNTSTIVTVSVTCPSFFRATNCPVYANTVSSSNSHCSNQVYYLEVLNTNCDGEIFFDVVGNYGSSYANEITWNISSNLTTNIIASGGPGTNGTNIFTTVGPINPNVQGSAFKITVYDSYGDGFSSGGYITIKQSGVEICTPITGNFGSQAHSMFMPNFLISPATITVSTPSGNVVQTVINCNDFRVPLNINNAFFCSTSSVNLPWEIICQSTGSVISSGTHSMTIYPNTPSDISDIVEISFDATNCEWVTNWPNDCTLSDLGSLFDISPDPTASVDACIAHSPQTFTLQYYGISGGPACCNTAGPSLPVTYITSTSNASVVSSPFGGVNNAAYLTIPANGVGGNATALNFTFNVSGYCFVHPNYDPTDFWITIMVDGNVVYDQVFADPASSANITINLADIPGGYNQNSIIQVYMYPNTFSVGTTYTTFRPSLTCGSIWSGEWTAGSFNLSVNAVFEELAPSPISCAYTDNINQPCCTVYPVSNLAAEICSGESFDVLTWQGLVNSANVGACIVFSSVLPVGGSVAPNGVFPNGINNTSNPIIQTVSAYSYCDANGSGSVNEGDTYTLLSTYSLTVNPSLTPVFTQLGPYCIGATPATLPSSSNNGITGTWSPSTISTATAGATIYTFTPTAGACATTTTLTITVNPNITPTFSPVSPYCSGATIPALPTTSTNGISGTWSPAINNTATTTYTFTPTSGVCVTTTTLTITITPNLTPTFAAVGPYCTGATIPALPTTSTNGITGTWSPAINNTSTTTYTFTPTVGQCATTTTLTISIESQVSPTFTPVGPYCSGATIPPLPTTSNNGITGTWSPAINNTSTTTYTFTPSAGGCATTTTLTITIEPNITPTFASVGPYCSGATIPALPTTSINGISGTWSPAINNTATTTYTFTPTSGACATTTTLTIIIEPNITPTFASVGPYCSGDIIPPLPTTSTNGISGTWSPAINNTATTVYTFTPTVGQCATTTTLTITIESNITPTFAPVGPYCSGDIIPPLPTTSTNGISGTWSPAINNTATTVYTFTPTVGQCATTTTLTITIEPNITPTFSAVGPYSVGETIPPLPTTSTNGVTGTWSPTINNTVTTTYTFTPTAGQCATTTVLTIIIDTNLIPTFIPVGPYCAGDIIPDLPLISTNGISGTWSPAINNTVTTTYTFTPTTGQSANTQTLTITINPNPTASILGNNPLCSGDSNGSINITISNGTPEYIITWGTNSIPISGSSYTIHNLSAGEYILLVTDANGCTNSATTNLVEPAVIDATVTYENPSCIGNNNGSIEINVVGGTSPYLFSWDGGASPVNYLSGLIEGIYIVIITDANQCVYKLNPVILEDIDEDCIRIPNAFTPNADGINDTWIIENIEMFPNSSIYVFNRWGQQLYHAKGLDDPWDGTYNGKFVPTGAYMYVINLYNGTKPYIGIVSVVY
ncbi:MAG: gliding motility-associated C-terminal domain-containing protein [Bacteroidales bacterium]|nr:gliding motility-associated C-terminal domain-containing protein [Bacteroidales bacterium]